MDTIADITAARRALRQYLAHADGKLPEDTFARLEELADSPSPVDQVAQSVELLYARRDELDDKGRTIVAQLAGFAAFNGWHGLATGNRGGLIVQAMRRDMDMPREPGQPAPQKAEDDPKPVAAFIRPAKDDAE